jgi:hypothetical protein
MLKRYQILIDDWLLDYLKKLSAYLSWSVSDLIRKDICHSITRAICSYHKEIKLPFSEEEYNRMICGVINKKIPKEELKKEMSRLMFETRILTEKGLAFLEKNKKTQNNKKNLK